MKKNTYTKVLIIILTIFITGCYGGQYYRPLTTTEYGRQIETTTNFDGRTSKKVIENEYIRNDPPERYYDRYNNRSYYNYNRPNYNRRRGRNVIRLCLFNNC